MGAFLVPQVQQGASQARAAATYYGERRERDRSLLRLVVDFDSNGLLLQHVLEHEVVVHADTFRDDVLLPRPSPWFFQPYYGDRPSPPRSTDAEGGV